MNTLSSNTKISFKGLTAEQLRLIALLAMLLDHLWGTIVPDSLWMNCVGRIAFPIFAFQLAEGAIHTSDMDGYARRLLKFAIISEIPFNLMMGGIPVYPFHQNVLFTLLLGLMGIRSIREAQAAETKKAAVKGGLKVVLFGLISMVGFVDYGIMGYATILAFYLLRGFKLARLCQFVVLLMLNQILFSGLCVPVTVLGVEILFHYQCFAVLALIPIWLYNGQQGGSSAFVRKLSYIFYPAHMLAIYLLWLLFM